MRPEPGPEHDDDNVAFRGLGLKLDHRFLGCKTGWHWRWGRRIVPTYDVERDTATQEGIVGQFLLQEFPHQSAFIGHIAGRGKKDAKVLWRRCRGRHQLLST